jgi:hypothetical protein
MIGILLDPPALHVTLTIPVVETPLASQGFQALVGRDILNQGLLVYSGKSGQLTLAF